jgi:hypothetical protein
MSINKKGAIGISTPHPPSSALAEEKYSFCCLPCVSTAHPTFVDLPCSHATKIPEPAKAHLG